jgi:hypothetical protein
MAAEIPPPLTAWPAGTRTGNASVDKVITLVEEKAGPAWLTSHSGQASRARRRARCNRSRCSAGMG